MRESRVQDIGKRRGTEDETMAAAAVQAHSAFNAYLCDAFDEVALQDEKEYQGW